jgi:hypothetical protein
MNAGMNKEFKNSFLMNCDVLISEFKNQKIITH